MAIFPPWTDTYILSAPSAYWQDLQCSIGYSFILIPDKPFDNSHVIAMDLNRLVGQWIVSHWRWDVFGLSPTKPTLAANCFKRFRLRSRRFDHYRLFSNAVCQF